MEIAIFILQCVVLLFILALYDKVQNKKEDKPINTENILANPKDLEIFRQGLKQGWMHVNISLYKMWTELEILDFDSIQAKLQQTLESLASNPNEMNKWAEKFNAYLEGQNK